MSRSELTSFHRDGDIGFTLLAQPGLAERVSEVFQYFDFHPDGPIRDTPSTFLLFAQKGSQAVRQTAISSRKIGLDVALRVAVTDS